MRTPQELYQSQSEGSQLPKARKEIVRKVKPFAEYVERLDEEAITMDGKKSQCGERRRAASGFEINRLSNISSFPSEQLRSSIHGPQAGMTGPRAFGSEVVFHRPSSKSYLGWWEGDSMGRE